MGGDGVEIVVARRPVEHRADAAGVGDHGHDVAGPARRILNREIAPRDALHRLDGLQHGIAAAIAAVQRHRAAAAAQIGQRRAMRLREIGDMDEVADAAAVRRRIVGAEHVDLGALAGGGLDRDFQQMRGADGGKPDARLADRRRRR